MNTVFALIAIVGGVVASLVAYKIMPLDKYVSPGEAEAWYARYGKLIRVLGPAAAIVGLALLVF